MLLLLGKHQKVPNQHCELGIAEADMPKGYVKDSFYILVAKNTGDLWRTKHWPICDQLSSNRARQFCLSSMGSCTVKTISKNPSATLSNSKLYQLRWKKPNCSSEFSGGDAFVESWSRSDRGIDISGSDFLCSGVLSSFFKSVFSAIPWF